jgi:hypothetical protein
MTPADLIDRARRVSRIAYPRPRHLLWGMRGLVLWPAWVVLNVIRRGK